MVDVANASPVPSAASDLSATSQTAFRQVGQCLSGEDAQLNVLYVLDASSSLAEDTDRDRLRGKILAQAIDQLGILSQDRKVFVAVSSFDLDYQERLPWQQVDADSAASTADWAEKQYDWWGAGRGTNWLAALEGGDQTMRESPDSKTACKMMVWLTDGGINVNGDKSDIQANASAMARICGTDPVTGSPVNEAAVVNSIRSSDVHLVGVLLRSEQYLDSLRKQGRTAELADELSRLSYMLPITESAGPVSNAAFTDAKRSEFTYTCGGSPIPGNQASGALLLGSNPIALAYRFSELANEIRGGSPVTVADDGTFVVEPGINFASIQLAGGVWTVRNGDGEVVATEGAPSPRPGVAISDQGQLVNVQLKGPVVAPGTWRVEVSDQLAPTQVYVNVLTDGVLDVPELQAGEASNITFTVNDRFTELPVSDADFDVSRLVVSAQEGSKGTVELACVPKQGQLVFECLYEPASVGGVHVAALAEISTKSGSNTVLAPAEKDAKVLPEATFPRVVSDSVSLSDLDGRRGQAEGTITLAGPDEGTGEVCLPAARDVVILSDVVDRAGEYTFEGPPWGTCVPLAEGETLGLPIVVTNPTTATGSVEAAFTAVLKSADSDREQTQEVRLAFDTLRPGSPPPWLLLALFAIGILIPVALLYGQARVASRLALKGLQMAVIPVRLSFEEDVVRVTREPARGIDLIGLDDWQYLPPSADRPRSFDAPEGVELAAVTPRNPLGSIQAVAMAPRGTRLLTSSGVPNDGRRGRIGLSPAGQWYIVAKDADLASDSSAVDAVLVAFASPTGGPLAESSAALSSSATDLSVLIGWASIRRSAGTPAQDRGESTSAPKSRRDGAGQASVSSREAGEGTEPVPDEQGQPNPFGNLGSGSSSEPRTPGRGESSPKRRPADDPAPPGPAAGGLVNPFDDM